MTIQSAGALTWCPTHSRAVGGLKPPVSLPICSCCPPLQDGHPQIVGPTRGHGAVCSPSMAPPPRPVVLPCRSKVVAAKHRQRTAPPSPKLPPGQPRCVATTGRQAHRRNSPETTNAGQRRGELGRSTLRTLRPPQQPNEAPDTQHRCGAHDLYHRKQAPGTERWDGGRLQRPLSAAPMQKKQAPGTLRSIIKAR